MNMGPWLFRDQGALMAEYDGFTNPRSVVLDKIVVWARILKLPDNYLLPATIKGMCRKMGKILDVQTTLLAGFAGEFVRVRVELNVTKKLIRFVGITKKEETEYYQVQYEKLPIFCGNCGILGHWYQECGTGEHDLTKLEWGDLVAASNAVEVLPVDTQAMLKKVMKTLPLFLHGERHEAGAIMHYSMKEQLTWKRRPEISRMVMRVRILGTLIF